MKKLPKQKKKLVNRKELAIRSDYKASGKLEGKVAIVTGGDSGIGRAVAVHFAREGADIAIVYRKSDEDARETQAMIEAENQSCLLFKGDISKEAFCRKVVRETHRRFKKLDILVNNAGTHEPADDLKEITSKQFRRTFEVNMFSFHYFTQEALKKFGKKACVINTASVTAFRGSEHLLDYSSTKGAIVSFTRSLAKNLAKDGVRVNCVSPGPVWTPLITESFDREHLKTFGKKTPMGRAGYPYEIAPAYVFLASDDASYITGQTIHINGGEIVG